MTGNLHYLIIMWGGAILLIGIGIYARNRMKPMWFWTGESISPDTISDVRAYNNANGKMWCFCSIPFWIIGVIELFYPISSIIFFGVICILGIPWIIWYHDKIERKYKI